MGTFAKICMWHIFFKYQIHDKLCILFNIYWTIPFYYRTLNMCVLCCSCREERLNVFHQMLTFMCGLPIIRFLMTFWCIYFARHLFVAEVFWCTVNTAHLFDRRCFMLCVHWLQRTGRCEQSDVYTFQDSFWLRCPGPGVQYIHTAQLFCWHTSVFCVHWLHRAEILTVTIPVRLVSKYVCHQSYVTHYCPLICQQLCTMTLTNCTNSKQDAVSICQCQTGLL